MNRSDAEIDRLLARGRLGGATRDKVLEDLLAEAAAREPRPSRWRLWLSALTLTAAGATAAILLLARPASDDERFRAKGAGGATPVLEIACQGGTLEACPIGSTLVFGVLGAQASGRLHAYAE